MYNYTSDNIETVEKGFINKNEILKYVSEEDIFNLVFGFRPVEYEYITSPFRVDKKPGCWFEYGINNRLVFRDFGYGSRPMDCFDAIKKYYKLDSFFDSLKFVNDYFIKGKDITPNNKEIKVYINKEVTISFESRDFFKKDSIFWERYQISKQNLIDDKVFPVNKFRLFNTKNGDIINRVYESCYAYTDFDGNRKKLYFPFRKGSSRFITNCKKNDIGNINKIPPLGRKLMVTKSYKDCRVIMNNLGCYSIWNQNEGMIPDMDFLIPIIKGYSEIIVWYDNDEQGIKSSKILSDKINQHLPGKARPLWLPENLYEKGITDPSDLIYKKSKQDLLNFSQMI
jgi:hypothetical protein